MNAFKYNQDRMNGTIENAEKAIADMDEILKVPQHKSYNFYKWI